MDRLWQSIIWLVLALWLIIVVGIMAVVSTSHAQQNIQQKGNNLVEPGLTNIGVLPCIASAAAPTYTEGLQVGCSTDLAGAVRMSGGGGGGGGTSSNFGAAFPAAGTAAGFSDGINMQGARVFDGDSGAGTEYVAGAILRCVASGGSTECFPPTAVSADTLTNQTATFIHGYGYMYNGATWDRIRGTIANGLLVNISNASLAVTQSTSPWVTNISQFGGNNVVTGTGTSGVGIPRVTVSNDSNILATQSGTWNINNISGTVSLPTGAATEATLATRLADATFTGRFVAATLDADALVNETTTAVHGKCYLYNGATWDRCRGTIAGGLLVNISNATLAVTQSGTWNIGTVTSITNTVTVQGTKSNNGGVPGANNEGVLPCVATAAAPAYTEGNQVGCSTNNSGATRTIEQNFVSTANNDGACPSGAANFTVAASNASRTWIAIWASPANTDDVYIKLGVTATSADGRIAPGQPINFTAGRIYTGQIDAFPASGTQAVCLMELN
jgi:hypothetical protein